MKLDIRNIVNSKSPGLAKINPVMEYLRRTIHEEEINSILEKHEGLPTVEFIRAALKEIGITYELVGIEKLDKKKRYIFASNHPFGGIDGLMLAEKVSDYFGDVRVVVNDLLMNLDPVKDIFIPINKHGRQSPEYTKKYNAAFASDIPIVTFPAGLCSRKKKSVVCDLDWKPNFIKQALTTQRDVVPVFFDGKLSNFFYRLSNFRTAIGIKANIEMFYLPDEMFKQKGSHFCVVMGDPIPWQEFDDGRSPLLHAERVKELAYNLRKKD